MVTSLKKEIVLTPEQEEAESLIEEWFFHLKTQIFVLCGYAGTGKTALVDYTVRRLGLKAGESAVFVAPTGKAASVLIRGGAPRPRFTVSSTRGKRISRWTKTAR